jgi:hypothetical protein
MTKVASRLASYRGRGNGFRGYLSFVMEPEGFYDLNSKALTWRNWQTRTAQDRMGKPVEVRVLS